VTRDQVPLLLLVLVAPALVRIGLPAWAAPALVLIYAAGLACLVLTPGRHATAAEDRTARLARVVALLAFLPAWFCWCLPVRSSAGDGWIPAVLIVFGVFVHGVLVNARLIRWRQPDPDAGPEPPSAGSR